MKQLLVVLIIALVAVQAAAQIGAPEAALIRSLSPNNVVETENGYSFGTLEFTPELRGDAVYRVSAEGSGTPETLAFAADLIGAATGYGDAIADPVSEFFDTRLGELAGQGPLNLPVQDYLLNLEVSGEAAPYDVAFTLSFPEVAEDAFPSARHTLGPDDARYVIREFSDFQCPFCSRFATQALPGIQAELLARGDVRFEYHHFPLQSIHPNAFPAAEAAECVTAANDPEAFWTYHDALFERQQAWGSLGDPNSYFVRLAQDLGLSSEGVTECLEARTYADEITAATQAAGGGLGISGTPSVFVNGYKIGDYTVLANYLRLMDLSDKFAEAQ